MHRPALVLLDEPTTGADVRTRAQILELVRGVAAAGSSVVYSTHYLHEVEELDPDVAFIDRGRIVAWGTPAELVAAHGSAALELTFDGPVPAVARLDHAVVDGAKVRIPADDPGAVAARLLPQLGAGRELAAFGRDRASQPGVGVPRGDRPSLRRRERPRERRRARDGAGRVMSPRRLRVVARHEMRLALRDPLPVMVLIVFPVITMAFLKPAFRPALVQSGHASANGAEQVVPGQATLSAFFVVSLVTFAFFSEFGWGTWDRLRASPATSFEIVIGKGLPRVVMAVAQFVVIFAAGVVVFGLDIRGDVLALVPLVLVFSVSLVLLGVAVTAVFRTAQQAQAFAIVGMVLFGAIGGALVPFDVLPGWARAIAPPRPPTGRCAASAPSSSTAGRWAASPSPWPCSARWASPSRPSRSSACASTTPKVAWS